MDKFIGSILLSAFMASPVVAASSPIDWRVEAGFAPFGYASDPNQLMQTWSRLSKANGATWEEALMSNPNRVSPFVELIHADASRAPWNPKTGQYDRSYVHPTSTAIRVSLPGHSGMCEWWLAEKKLSQMAACAEETRIANVPLGGVTLNVRQVDTGEKFNEGIVVDHRVVLAIGDSYASGEGNPDIPTEWKSTGVRSGDIDWIKNSIRTDSQWWDNACHRSFWSNQTLVALKIAASNPHRLVTYLQYSCSGAEVLDGMITRQENPPGIAGRCSGASCYLKSSQIAAAVRDLCVDQVVTVGVPGDRIVSTIDGVVWKDSSARLYRSKNYRRGKGLDLVKCSGKLRSPDLVLLSIGGNDAGFAQLAAWAIVPSDWSLPLVGRLVKGGVVCPDTNHEKWSGCKKPFDVHLAYQIQRRYWLLAYVLKEVLPVAPDRVVQSTYPDPMLQSTDSLCSDRLGYDPKSPWVGAASLVPVGRPEAWQYNITEDEALTLSRDTIPRMLTAMMAGIKANGFVLADMHELFKDHGWCAAPPSDPSLALPSFETESISWRCNSSPDAASPACWAPYAPSKRFIRTMNDSLLTQSSDRKDGHNGAVHPNLWGHAAMADGIYKVVFDTLPWARE